VAIDPATWTTGGVAAAEAVAIGVLVASRRRHRERGRRVRLALSYQGRDTVDDVSTERRPPDTPPDPVTPDE